MVKEKRKGVKDKRSYGVAARSGMGIHRFKGHDITSPDGDECISNTATVPLSCLECEIMMI